MFRPAKTIVRPLSQNFHKKAKYSVIIFAIRDVIHRTIFKYLKGKGKGHPRIEHEGPDGE